MGHVARVPSRSPSSTRRVRVWHCYQVCFLGVRMPKSRGRQRASKSTSLSQTNTYQCYKRRKDQHNPGSEEKVRNLLTDFLVVLETGSISSRPHAISLSVCSHNVIAWSLGLIWRARVDLYAYILRKASKFSTTILISTSTIMGLFL